MKSEQRKEIQDLLDILTQENLAEIEIERKDLRIRIRRDSVQASTSTPTAVSSPVLPAPSSVERVTSEVTIKSHDIDTSGLLTVTAPIVGTFYRSPSEDADAYVEENDLVTRGQVLCIVEAMKLMNEIESETDGRLVKILVETGMTVEYGQPLFLIDPYPAS